MSFKNKKVVVLLLTISLIITVSCSKNSETDDANDALIEELKQKNIELTEEIERLNKAIEESSKPETKEVFSDNNKILENYRAYSKDYTKESEFKWMNQDSWDKIVVYNEGEFDKNNVIIEDERILSIKPMHITGEINSLCTINEEEKAEGVNYFDGNETIKYVYLFKSGDNSYKIEVVDEDTVLIDGQPYKTKINSEFFGKSLIKHKYTLELKDMVDKAINSNLCIRKYSNLKVNSDSTYDITDYHYSYFFDNKLYREVMVAITSVMKITSNPLFSDTAECFPLAQLTYYYYGEIINVEIYNKHIHLHNINNEDVWFVIKNENIRYYNDLKERIK